MSDWPFAHTDHVRYANVDAMRHLNNVVFLRYFGGLSYAEIALVCGIREGTVGAALARAHETLREELCDPAGTEGRMK